MWCNAWKTIRGGVARVRYTRGIEKHLSKRAGSRSPHPVARLVAAPLRVALEYGGRGNGHPLPISAAVGGLVPTRWLARGDEAQDGRPRTPALAKAGGGDPGSRCSGYRPISGRLGDSRMDQATVWGELHPGWGLQPIEAAEVFSQSAPSGPRQDYPPSAGNLEKGERYTAGWRTK
jgi:hypothetical protein